MILGIGVDIVEIGRMRKAVAKEAFVKRVFSEAEAAYCRSREGRLLDIEIVNDELGCPKLLLYGAFRDMAEARGLKHAWISISHAREHAVAQCVFEG